MNTIYRLLLIIALLVPQYAFSKGQLCQTILEPPVFFVQYGLDINEVKNNDTYEVNIEDYGYYFTSHLNENGTLTFSVYLHNHELGLRSHLRGSDLFAEMIQHFGKERINSIVARWSEGTNYDLFFAALAQGYSHEDAALQTWTGRMAAAHGYNHVKFVEIGRVAHTLNRAVLAEFTQ